MIYVRDLESTEFVKLSIMCVTICGNMRGTVFFLEQFIARPEKTHGNASFLSGNHL